MKTFEIRNFSGIETKFDPEDQDRGTLQRADGFVVAPRGAIGKGPRWRTVWGIPSLASAIEGVLGGATAGKVHFVTLAHAGITFLIAWEKGARARGCWQVVGNTDPHLDVDSGGAHVLSAPTSAIYRDKAAGKNWFGSWCGGRLILGNGADANLVWKGGALSVFGPDSPPADESDPSRYRIPPCTAFNMDVAGALYAAGNADNPLRVWKTDPPNLAMPYNEGVASEERSYVDIITTRATKITALSSLGGATVAHLDIDGAVMLASGAGTDGFPARQVPIAVNAGAINPNCTRDAKEAGMYFGTDLEVYSIRGVTGRDKENPRNTEIKTNRSAGEWNVALGALTPSEIGTGDRFIISDDRGNRLWIWTKLEEGGRQCAVVYDVEAFAITGPILYPDFICGTGISGDAVPGALAVGITRDGAFLFGDLQALGLSPSYEDIAEDSDDSDVTDEEGETIRLSERRLTSYRSAIGAEFSAQATAPEATLGLPYVGISADGLQFRHVLNGQALELISPWENWSASDGVTATRFFANATVAVMDILDEDFGSPEALKEVMQLRIQMPRNMRVYFAVFGEADGRRSGKWRGTAYPKEEFVAGLHLVGRRFAFRVIAVYFNDEPLMIHGLSIDYEMASPA